MVTLALLATLALLQLSAIKTSTAATVEPQAMAAQVVLLVRAVLLATRA